MWKESYKLGVDSLDEQHKSLCDMVEGLIHIINSGEAAAKKQECINAIVFLKDYVGKHFSTEETYMASINYAELEKHKMLHTVLGKTVMVYEKKMVEADFSVSSIKEFIGFVTAWLTYHMAVEDLKIISHDDSDIQTKKIDSYLEGFIQSSRNVIEEMAKIQVGKVHENISNSIMETNVGTSGANVIRIIIRQFRPHKYEVVFYFDEIAAFGLIKALSSMQLDVIDELAYSTLSEIVSTINRRALLLFPVNDEGEATNIVPVPKLLDISAQIDHTSGFYYDTEIGQIAVSIKC